MKKLLQTLAWLAALLCAGARAEDIDIFTAGQGVYTPGPPNILFIVDNRPNWSRQSQHWDGGITQGEAELLAINNFLAGINRPVNVGLMLLDTTNNSRDGGYVRFALRDMSVSANNAAFQNVTNHIRNNINSPSEKINQSSGNFANALYEAWLYYNGANSWAGMSPNADRAGNTQAGTASKLGMTSGFAYAGATAGARYNSPLGNGCGRNYIIFIGNNANQMPAVPASGAPSLAKLSQYGYSTQPDVASAWARFLLQRPDLTPGSVAAAQGSTAVFTIDVFKSQQNTAFTQIMKNMARNGGGRYFEANDSAELAASLNSIYAQIQAVNSTFASASLPVSVSVRGTHLNQVYMGVFRPDAHARPNWTGNLKQYQIGVDTQTAPPTLFLADAQGDPVENTGTGFVNPGATSFWTSPSTFWNDTYFVSTQGEGGVSDAPDGDLVEKGGAAQRLRAAYATGQSARKVYTCTGACATTPGTLLSASEFSTGNSAVTAAALGASSTADRDAIINWVRGANVTQDENPSTSTTAVRAFVHGDVLHSRPTVINYGRTADDLVVYYGANDGLLHAVRGGQNTAAGAGSELWAFAAPEHFNKLKALRDHAPLISAGSPKPYFFDGSPTVYTSSTGNDGRIDHTRGDKALLFVPMRRGGRALYAFDVSNPEAPRILWRKSSADTGYTQMAQTWSDPKVARIRGHSGPVLVFGLGYDAAANDATPQATATTGRGVLIVDAMTGAPLWQAGPSPSGAGHNLTVSGMLYSVAAPLTLYDSNGDGFIDRAYAVDTGANVWRINLDDASPAAWTVSRLAALGGPGVNARRFLFAPDLVPASSSTPHDTLLIGSGDREHPFDTTVRNRFYMIKDDHAINAGHSTPVVEGQAGALTGEEGRLYDATQNLVQTGTAEQKAAAKAAMAAAAGWYITLVDGEKTAGGSTTMAGTVVFGTNRPTPPAPGTCATNLGEARLYTLDYLTGAATLDNNNNGVLTASDRYQVLPGGGYPPTPVPISVILDGKDYQAVITGTRVVVPEAPRMGRRYRTYWHREID